MDDEAVCDGYLRASHETGTAITAISPGDLNDLGLTSPPGSRNARDCVVTTRIAIDAAVEMHVPLVFLPSFRAGEICTQADLRQTAEMLADACEYVAGRPVTIATENTLDAEGNLRLLAAAGRPELRVLLDTQNPALWGHVVADMVETLWRHLADQVHVKDGRDGQMGTAVLGEGQSGFPETARTLRKRGFAGTLISENDYHGERSRYATMDIAAMIAAFGP
jgi:sugar phosphate isomerase/epimerase